MGVGRTRLAALAAVASLAACDGRPAGPPVDDGAFDAQAGALGRAADVQRVTEEQERRLRRAVEDAEGG